jgi:N-acetylmuramic acid 6-phosphate etherase
VAAVSREATDIMMREFLTERSDGSMEMPLPLTEQRNSRSATLGELDAAGVIALMDAEEGLVGRAVQAAAAEIAAAAEVLARCFLDGGRVVLAGGGTSGHLVVQEVAELGPTFGVPTGRFVAMIASGTLTGTPVVTADEDDVTAAVEGMAALAVGAGDVVVGVAASGSTPFTLSAVVDARGRGAMTVGVANNAGSPLLREAGLPVLLDTGPELLTGSSRLKAGSAQKAALNRMTMAAMVLAGRVRSNYMVDLRGTNDKLRARATRIVADLSGADTPTARAALERSDWQVRAALDLLGCQG